MARLCKLVLVVSLLLGAPAVADAAIITINPNDFPFGTDVSTMFDGLTISQIEGRREGTGGVFSAEPFEPVTRTPAVVRSSLDPLLNSIGRGHIDIQEFWAIELLFTAPTNYLNLNFVWGSDQPIVFAYDPLGTMLHAGFAPGQYGGISYAQLTLDRAAPDIERVVLGGYAGNAYLTGLSYDNPDPVSVPEPSTLLFVSMGAALTLIRARQRKG